MSLGIQPLVREMVPLPRHSHQKSAVMGWDCSAVAECLLACKRFWGPPGTGVVGWGQDVTALMTQGFSSDSGSFFFVSGMSGG